MSDRVRSLLHLLPLFLIVFAFAAETLPVFAQTSIVVPPVRRPRNLRTVPVSPPGPTPRPPAPGGEQIGTVSQGLDQCDAGLFDANGFLSVPDFTSDHYVLGLAPAFGSGTVDDSQDVISFWLIPRNHLIQTSMADLQAVTAAGGDLSEAVLIGQRDFANGEWDMFAVGACANIFNNNVDGWGFLSDLFFVYFNDPALSPQRTVDSRLRDVTAAIESDTLVAIAVDPNLPSAFGPVVAEGIADKGLLSLGTSSGSITTTGGDSFQVNVTGRTDITVNVTSAVDTVAEIYDENGGLIASDDDSGGNANPALQATLPYDGSYRLVVHAYSPGTIGDYQLTVSMAVPDTAPTGDVSVNPLPFGTSGGSMSGGEVVNFQFYGEAGNTFWISVTSPALDTTLEILDENGTSLAYNDDSNDTLDPELVLDLPYTGYFTVVLSAFDGVDYGDYEMYVSLDGAQASSAGSGGCPNLPPPMLYIGASVSPTSGNQPRVRADHNTGTTILSQMRTVRDIATVIDGPVCDDSRVWWNVNFNGVIGWSAEVDSDSEYLLAVR
jgi:hypothetical protein